MFPLPLVVTVRPSRRLRLAVAALHLAAGLALWLADLRTDWQIAGTALLAGSLLIHLRPGQAVTLRAKSDGLLEIRVDQSWKPAKAFQVRLLLPTLTLLSYPIPGKSRPGHLAILPDSLPAEDFRRLRVWLKWLGDKHSSETAQTPSEAV